MPSQDFLDMLQGTLNKVANDTAIAQKLEKYKAKVRYDDMVRSVRHLRTAYNRETEHMESLSRHVRLLGCKNDGMDETLFIIFNMGNNFREISRMLRGKQYKLWHGDIDRPSEVLSVAILGSSSMIGLDIIKRQYDETCLFFCDSKTGNPYPFTGTPETVVSIPFLFLNAKLKEIKKELDKSEALLKGTEEQIDKIKKGE